MAVIIDGTNGITTPPVALLGSTSGTISLVAPAVAGTNTQTLVAATGTLAPLISGTAVASTSGTSIDFTSIPSWVKRITVMFAGVSTNGTSFVQVQAGSGSPTTSGYVGTSQNMYAANSYQTQSSTTGWIFTDGGAADTRIGHLVITNISGNTWIGTGAVSGTPSLSSYAQGNVTLAGTLDRVRITTVNGTDTFDAGSVNILWE